MKKSLIEIAYDYLHTVSEPQTIETIFKNVKKLSKLTEKEFESKKAQLYTDFTLCSNFVYCGNGWDLKERQPEALFDADSSYFVDPKERKKIAEKRKLEKKEKEVAVEDDIEIEVAGFENVEEYKEFDDYADDSYDDDDIDDIYENTNYNEDEYDEEFEEDDEDFENIINKYEDLYNED